MKPYDGAIFDLNDFNRGGPLQQHRDEVLLLWLQALNNDKSDPPSAGTLPKKNVLGL